MNIEEIFQALNETTPKKVFCKDCKFLHLNFFDNKIETCNRTSYTVIKNDPIYGETCVDMPLPIEHPRDRNKDLNCKYFIKKKWY